MQSLPKEITSKILKYLSGREILQNCNVNSQFHQVCSSDPKYNNLWRQKIEEDFQEAYMGDNAFNQYTYLNKLYQQNYYLVTYRNTDEKYSGTKIIGLYDLYGKAVMAVIREVEKDLSSGYFPKRTSYESLRYALWNKNYIELNDIYLFSIEEIKMGKLETVYDERNFFTERENLYRALFSQDSKGASTFIPGYDKNKERPKSGEDEFYRIFDKAMSWALDRNPFNFDTFLKILQKDLKITFDERQREYLRKYSKSLVIDPKEVGNNNNNNAAPINIPAINIPFL